MYVGRGLGMCAHGLCGGQKHQIALELELQAAVSHLMWVLGIEIRKTSKSF